MSEFGGRPGETMVYNFVVHSYMAQTNVCELKDPASAMQQALEVLI